MQIFGAGTESLSGEKRYILDNGEQHTIFSRVEVVNIGVFLKLDSGLSSNILYGDTAEEFKRLWAEVEK